MTSAPHAEEFDAEAQAPVSHEVSPTPAPSAPEKPGSRHATTLLRGVCILVIVAHHYFRLGPVVAAGALGTWLALGGHLAVAGFLALSGFGLERAARQRPTRDGSVGAVAAILAMVAVVTTVAVNHVVVWPLAFAALGLASALGPTQALLGRRWARLTPPLVTAAILVSAPVALVAFGPTRAALWFTVATGGWFIRFLWLQYVAYHLGHAISEKRAAAVAFAVVGVAAIGLAATGDPYSASFALAFPLGMLVGRMQTPPRSRTLFGLSLIPLALVVGAAFTRIAAVPELLQPAQVLGSGVAAVGLFLARLAAPTAAALVVLAAALSPLANRSASGVFARSLGWLGENSLGIYLANVALMPLFRRLPPSMSPIMSFALVTAASIALGYCVTWSGSRLFSRLSRSSS